MTAVAGEAPALKHWNCRVVLEPDGRMAIYDVYYDAEMRPRRRAMHPSVPEVGNARVETLRECVAQIGEALTRPILNAGEIGA